MTEEFDLTEVLSEQEIELINLVRGYNEDGEPIANGMRLTLEFRGGRWLVETRYGFSGPTLYGEGSLGFSEAWIDRVGAELRFAMPDEVEDEEEAVPAEVQAALDASRPKPRPRLQIIKGGKDA